MSNRQVISTRAAGAGVAPPRQTHDDDLDDVDNDVEASSSGPDESLWC